jgi:hypothetical protein
MLIIILKSGGRDCDEDYWEVDCENVGENVLDRQQRGPGFDFQLQ